MEHGRIRHDGRARWVRRDGATLALLSGAPWEPGVEVTTEPALAAESADWLASVAPSKILAYGRNYRLHAEEQGAQVPERPLLFLKAPSALLGSGCDVALPPESDRVECEGELALVIGRRCRRRDPAADPREVVFGYLPADDVTARDLQRADGQWARGKSFDTFCPLARTFSTDAPSSDACLRTEVTRGGETTTAQEASLADMVFPVGELLAHASGAMTLEPGDVVLTGTPAGVMRLEPGDRVRVSIDGLPELTHGVVSEPLG